MVRVGTSKGSTISHMAAVHPGHQLPEALQKRRRSRGIAGLGQINGVLTYIVLNKIGR